VTIKHLVEIVALMLGSDKSREYSLETNPEHCRLALRSIPLTGILGGTPTSGVNGSLPISFTASNGVGSVTLNFTVTVGQLAFSPSTINFGDAFPYIAVSRTLTITNAGTSTVTFTKFSIAAISGDDSSGFLYFSLCPKTLVAGKSCTIIMGLTPDSNFTKAHAANFLITDNAAGSPQVVPMLANVISASLSTLSLNFGNQRTGRRVRQNR
jgi:hypothetical protein